MATFKTSSPSSSRGVRKRPEWRLALQYAVTRVLADYPNFTEAAREILKQIGTGLEWCTGLLWTVDKESNSLHLRDVWHAPGCNIPEFDRASSQTFFRAGVGLPGLVWESGKAAWINDLAKETGFPRSRWAAKEHLHAGFAFPISGKHQVYGVIEFYAQSHLISDEELLELFNAIGSQIGQFVERTGAEEALRENEARYRSVLEALGEGIVTIAADGRILTCNRGAEEILGIPAKELESSTTQDPRWRLLDENGSPLPLEKYPVTRTLTTGKPLNNMVMGIYKPDGTVAWLAGNTRPLFRDNEAQPYAVVVSFLDISQRRTDRQQLEHSLSLVTATLESTTDGLLVVDNEGRIASFNQQFARMWRIPKSILLARDDKQALSFVLDQLISPELFIQKVQELYAQPDAESYDVLNFKDGRVFERFSKPQYLGQKSVGRVWSFRDITSRRRTEETLRQLAAIVECSDDMIIGHGLDGTIHSWNSGAEQLCGYSSSEAVGQSLSMLGDEHHQDEFKAILEQVAQGRSLTHFETVWKKKNHQLLTVSLTVSPVTDAQGVVVSAATVARDMTERKKAEKAIRELNEGLEQQVVERTSELTAANQELESFSYSISHDLRAPLRAIQGFAQILLDDHSRQLDSEGRRLLKVVSQNAQRMSELIDDLLRFSQISRKALVKKTVKMEDLVRTVIEELRENERTRDVEWVINQLPNVPADLAMIRQVIMNLLSNALKFTRPKAHARIEVGCRIESNENIYFVRDNGVGFEMQYAGKLFGVFQRLHSVDEFEGTGVGLAIVQLIVHKHGGRAWAHSQLNAGAEFFFTLPCS